MTSGQSHTVSTPIADADKSLSATAYDELLTLIITCTIQPGEWVSESQLATDLGLGKTPTREALRRLAREGFVEPTHRRGYQVAPITPESVIDTFEVISVLLGEVAVLVAERASLEEKHRAVELTLRWMAAEPGDPVGRASPYPYFVSLTRNRLLGDVALAPVGHLERMYNFGRVRGAFRVDDDAGLLEPAFATVETAGGDAVRQAIHALLTGLRDRVLTLLPQTSMIERWPHEMA